MKLQRQTWVLLVSLLLVTVGPTSARKWTDSTGKFSIEAELMEVKDGSARLKRQDGEIITVRLNRLSKTDRDYVKARAAVKARIQQARIRRKILATTKKSVAFLEKLGGTLTTQYEEILPPRTGLSRLLLPDDDRDILAVTDVDLTSTKVKDADLKHLEGMSYLNHLELGDTNITDAGLTHLSGLRGLETLGLRDTKVTDEGVKKLQQALPKCKIIH